MASAGTHAQGGCLPVQRRQLVNDLLRLVRDIEVVGVRKDRTSMAQW
jgi:hypothetical protein